MDGVKKKVRGAFGGRKMRCMACGVKVSVADIIGAAIEDEKGGRLGEVAVCQDCMGRWEAEAKAEEGVGDAGST